MGKSLAYKILEKNLLSGELKPGNEISVKVNQTLTQDSTGTMVYLQLEAMGITDIKTDLSVAYIDHNTLQSGFENADDHELYDLLLQNMALCILNLAMEFAISCTLSVSENQVTL